jgi:hypothetical protein
VGRPPWSEWWDESRRARTNRTIFRLKAEATAPRHNYGTPAQRKTGYNEKPATTKTGTTKNRHNKKPLISV